MSLPVFLSDAVTGASTGVTVVLEGDEGRHAATVMRLRAGERLILTDGAGVAATCTVTAAGKGSLTARVDAIEHAERRLPRVTVVQAIPKGDRGELAVEMLTEVDVDRIVPWAASRSVAVWRGERAERSLAKWRAAARAATKQSRRVWLPEVTEMAGTDEVAGMLAAADLAVVLHEDAQIPLAALPVTDVESIVLVVGPEGGLSDEELERFAGAEVARIGTSVLRTSTAGVVAVAVLLSRTSRWG